MNNTKALSSLCTAVCSTFYPDKAAMEIALFNRGIDPEAEATPKDPGIFRCAADLVFGYIESSRSEGGVSTSVREDAVKDSLRHWCREYGLDTDDELSEWQRIVEDGSRLW